MKKIITTQIEIWRKDRNSWSVEIRIQNMAFTHMRRCSTLLLREIQIETIICYFSLSKTETADVADEGVGKQGLLHTIGSNADRHNPCRGQSWYYLSTKNANPTYRNFSKRHTHVHKKVVKYFTYGRVIFNSLVCSQLLDIM